LATDEAATEDEPQRLTPPVAAAAIQPSRNPFQRSMMPVEADSTAANHEAAEANNEVADEAAVDAEEDLIDEQPMQPIDQDRYSSQTSFDREPPAEADSRYAATAEPNFADADGMIDEESTDPQSDQAGEPSAFEPVSRAAATGGNVDGSADEPATGGTGKPGDTRLEGAQSPRLVIEKTAPDEIQIGKTATFTVVVRNEGDVSAQGVQVFDEIPQGTELVATQPKAQESAGKLRWQLGELKPGAEASVQMQVTPLVEGEVGSVASVTFMAGASAKSTVTRPRLELEVTAEQQILIGDQLTLQIAVSNPGTGVAQGIVVTEKVPGGMTHPGGGELEFEVGTLAPGETRRMELTLLATKPGEMTNVLLAKGADNLQAEEQTEIEVLAPELKVGLTGPKRRYLQRKATYQLSVSNPGTAPANDVELEAMLPAGMEFVDANNQGQYDSAAHRVVWSLEALPAGETGTATVTLLAVESGEQPMRVSGKAQMNLADQVEEAISIEGVAAILFELVDVHDPVEVNGQTSYEIRVTNQGSAAASGVRVAAILPPGLEITGAEGPVGHKVEAGRVLFEPLAQLAPKADTSYLIHVKTLAAGDQRVKVQVVTDNLSSPITKEESTRVYSDE
jgi:uncharacterized repeat protein (TIGR01451 family)